MSHFRMGKTFEHLIILYKSGADTGADCDVHGGISVPARSEAELSETGGVHICINSNRHTKFALQFIEQRKILPGCFRSILYRSVSFTSVIQIDGAESTDTKRVNRVLPENIISFLQGLLLPPRSDYISVFRFIEFIQHRTDKLCSVLDEFNETKARCVIRTRGPEETLAEAADFTSVFR